jgi:hypothetical protein
MPRGDEFALGSYSPSCQKDQRLIPRPPATSTRPMARNSSASPVLDRPDKVSPSKFIIIPSNAYHNIACHFRAQILTENTHYNL